MDTRSCGGRLHEVSWSYCSGHAIADYVTTMFKSYVPGVTPTFGLDVGSIIAVTADVSFVEIVPAE